MFEHQDCENKIEEVEEVIQYICDRIYKEKFLKDVAGATNNLKSERAGEVVGE